MLANLCLQAARHAIFISSRLTIHGWNPRLCGVVGGDAISLTRACADQVCSLKCVTHSIAFEVCHTNVPNLHHQQDHVPGTVYQLELEARLHNNFRAIKRVKIV